jgi:hypothetical protein
VPVLNDVKDFLSDFRSKPLHSVMLLVMLGVGISLTSFLTGFGEDVSHITIDKIRSSWLVRSQSSALTYRVAVVNKSSVSDSKIRGVVDVLQKQVKHDFAPVWGISASLRFVPRGSDPTQNEWILEIADASNEPDMASYHTINEEGLPFAQIAVSAARKLQVPWEFLASHELLTLLVNPRANLNVFAQSDSSDGTGTIYAFEVAAPCEGVSYTIDGVVVSDFVTPAWFTVNARARHGPFDFLNRIEGPLEALPGGHVQAFEVKTGGPWRRMFNASPPKHGSTG